MCVLWGRGLTCACVELEYLFNSSIQNAYNSLSRILWLILVISGVVTTITASSMSIIRGCRISKELHLKTSTLRITIEMLIRMSY